MMAKLYNRTRQQLLANQVESAHNVFSRMKGLLGRDALPSQTTLWLKPGNSIHTWFMKFSIDVIFTDRNLKVVSVAREIAPWKMIWPIWGAVSVFEFAAGTLQQRVQPGDELYVGD